MPLRLRMSSISVLSQLCWNFSSLLQDQRLRLCHVASECPQGESITGWQSASADRLAPSASSFVSCIKDILPKSILLMCFFLPKKGNVETEQ